MYLTIARRPAACCAQHFFYATVAFFGVAILADHCQGASFNITTDATNWRAIGPAGTTLGSNIGSVGLAWESTNVGWNTSVAYDDSNAAGWTNPNLVHTDVSTNNIWPGDGHSGSPSPAYFRREFNIGGIPSAGSLDVNVDDDAQVWLNGVLVYSDSNGIATVTNGIDVSSKLISGNNLLAIKAYNRQGDAGLISTIHVTYTVPEPSTIALLFSGAIGAIFLVRRRGGTTSEQTNTGSK